MVKNFNPNASTIDEADMEREWKDSLRHTLGRAEIRFRQLNKSMFQPATTEETPSELSLALREYLRQRRAA